MDSHTSSQLPSSSNRQPVPGKAATLRQRISTQLQRSLPSTHSLASVSTKSIKLKNSNSVWATVSSKAHSVFSRSVSLHSIKARKLGLHPTPPLATIQEGIVDDREHVGARTIPEDRGNATAENAHASATRAILTVDYNPPEKHHMPRAIGIVVDEVEPPTAPCTSPLSNRPDEPHGSGREEASDNPSGRGLPRRKFLPRPRLRLAPIRRTSAGVQGLPTQTVSAKLRRSSLERVYLGQPISSQKYADRFDSPVQAEPQHTHATDRQALRPPSSQNTPRVKRKCPPSSNQQAPQECVYMNHPPRPVDASAPVGQYSNRSSPQVKRTMTPNTTSSAMKSRDLNIKPLPSLPPRRRQHRMSMKPPSFIPLDLAQPGSGSYNTLFSSSVQFPRSVHRSTKPSYLRPLHESVKSREVAGQQYPRKTLNGALKARPQLPKSKPDQENRKPILVSHGVHRNTGRPQKISCPSVTEKVEGAVSLLNTSKKLACTAPRSETAKLQGRRPKFTSPCTAPPNPKWPLRGPIGPKSDARDSRVSSVSSSIAGRRTPPRGMNKDPKRCTDRLTKDNTFNGLATKQNNTHRVADTRTSGTAVRSAIVASETLDLRGVAVDEAPIVAERPLTALFQPATDLSMRPLLVRSPKHSASQDRSGKIVAAYRSHDRSVSHYSISTASIPSTLPTPQPETSQPADPFQVSTKYSGHPFSRTRSTNISYPDPLTCKEGPASPVQKSSTSVPAWFQHLRPKCAATMPAKKLSSAEDNVARESYLPSYDDPGRAAHDVESLKSAQLRRDRLRSYGLAARHSVTLTDCYGDRCPGLMEKPTTSDETAAAVKATWDSATNYNDTMVGDRTGIILDHRNGAIGATSVAGSSFDSSFGSEDQSTTAEGEQSFLDMRLSYLSVEETGSIAGPWGRQSG